jgi:hypothetical protein
MQNNELPTKTPVELKNINTERNQHAWNIFVLERFGFLAGVAPPPHTHSIGCTHLGDPIIFIYLYIYIGDPIVFIYLYIYIYIYI